MSRTYLPVLLLVAALPTLGATIRVPLDAPTIQVAVDLAVDGDRVVLEPGIYSGPGNRDVDLRGKAILVRSARGPAGCVLDCQGAGRAFLIRSGEGPDTRLKGLTIRNGYSGSVGGGILCIGSSPSITGCVIDCCAAYFQGGGIHCQDAGPTLTNCTIRNCRSGFWGGGLCVFQGTGPRLESCRIERCVADIQGGGIYVWASPIWLMTCQVLSNRARSGGGLFLQGVFQGNLTQCFIERNRAGQDGGGALLDGGALHFRSCTFRQNRAGRAGGALMAQSAEPNLSHSILWDDRAPRGPELAVGRKGYPARLWIQYCDVRLGQSGAAVTEDSILEWGSGMTDVDPLFVDGPDGSSYLSQVAAGQSVQSPSVNAGPSRASHVCYSLIQGSVCASQLTTRTDERTDAGLLDQGAHHLVSETPHPP